MTVVDHRYGEVSHCAFMMLLGWWSIVVSCGTVLIGVMCYDDDDQATSDVRPKLSRSRHSRAVPQWNEGIPRWNLAYNKMK
jgi:hypothetical protein